MAGSAYQNNQSDDDDATMKILPRSSSPANRLYKHALESIFSLLSLVDLNSVLAVSRSWSAAVNSMRGIGARIERLSALNKVCASRLARHIGTLGSRENPIVLAQEEEIRIMCTNMIGLRSLYCELREWYPGMFCLPRFMFPSSLTQLTVKPWPGMEPRDVARMMAAVGRLTMLTSFETDLDAIAVDQEFSFAPLRHCTQLTALSFYLNTDLSLQQADELRAISNLTELDLLLKEDELLCLLRAPHQLQWTALKTYGHLNSGSIALLAAQPTLTALEVFSEYTVTFLQSLVNLRCLDLNDFALEEEFPSPPAEQLIEGHGPGWCQQQQLTQLNIDTSRLTSAHLSALLSLLPAVSLLSLCNMEEMESLSFLASGSLPRTITSLTLEHCRHPLLHAEELHHLFCLRQLTSLSVSECFSERLDSFTLAEFKLPSARLPKLTTSVVKSATRYSVT